MILKEIHLTKLKIDAKWLEPITKSFRKFILCNSNDENENINEAAMFLAQCSHESKNFTRLEENLKYSAHTLFRLFPKKVGTLEYAEKVCEQGAQAVGNLIYGNRVDLGNYNPTDGYRYRGRGIIQLTGRNNYKYYGEKLGFDLVNNPDLAKEPYVACNIACCYWKVKTITPLAREGNVIMVTKKINGGLNGLEDRKKRFEESVKVLSEG